jgi:hypothetical protein
MISNKQKVFNIGFHKTGTTSLTQFMHDLGYKSLHSVAMSMNYLNLGLQGECEEDTGKPGNFESLIDKAALHEAINAFDFFSDNPWPLLYQYLDKNYPNSKFILTIRDKDRWINSLVKHSGPGNTKMRQLIYGYGNPANHTAQYRKTYIRHNKNVQEYFKQKDNLLVINIEEDNDILAENVLNFLGIEQQGLSFPNKNERKG